MNRFPQKPVRLDKSEFKTDIGVHNTIFVGSSCDMWAEDIPSEWITQIIEYCKKYPSNNFLFQSKNPKRFFEFVDNDFLDNYCNDVIFGCTIESNRDYDTSKAPKPIERVPWMWEFTDQKYRNRFRTMVSVEPILDFDLNNFILMLMNINPEFVSIGADSKGHGLPEPSSNDVKQLIKSLKQFTDVKVKDNLNRIIKEKQQ